MLGRSQRASVHDLDGSIITWSAKPGAWGIYLQLGISLNVQLEYSSTTSYAHRDTFNRWETHKQLQRKLSSGQRTFTAKKRAGSEKRPAAMACHDRPVG